MATARSEEAQDRPEAVGVTVDEDRTLVETAVLSRIEHSGEAGAPAGQRGPTRVKHCSTHVQ
eukprot:CAMPEP_0194334270 /NCGR_PEP_ID=MMETSP0171-20130528/65530_1 /TAXON_ID=218684 /ORGANISM="Corethron pennatum, Strain L29A3" /LENGTH=61 /DNA_ID=CAMNT_0039096849 /DNA_START=1138 /DNA_END=1323 /DNA_ORIENTATION=+